MYVKITATDQDLESFCYLPLKSGEVYQANYSKIESTFCVQLLGNDEYKTFLDVIVDEETIVKGVHESRLQILTQDEIRDFRINQIINC